MAKPLLPDELWEVIEPLLLGAGSRVYSCIPSGFTLRLPHACSSAERRKTQDNPESNSHASRKQGPYVPLRSGRSFCISS
jgi:hypothetical protein